MKYTQEEHWEGYRDTAIKEGKQEHRERNEDTGSEAGIQDTGSKDTGRGRHGYRRKRDGGEGD